MDKALKERIIGAIVLVAVAVLIVPVFLDGPPADDEIVSTTVPLPGQSDQKVQTVVLDRDRDAPVPSQVETQPVPMPQATSTPASEPPAQATPQPVVETPPAEAAAEAPAPVAEAPREATPVPTTDSSATGMWAVQLGSFSNQQNAEKLAADLRQQGFAAFLSQLATSSGQLHRVRVGPQKDREAAEAMAARLQTAGHTGKVLPHP